MLPEPDYVLTFRVLPDANKIPVEIRLRRLLKHARRQCSLSCTDIRQLKRKEPPHAANETPADNRDSGGPAAG